jgi:hypothetical protein
MEGAFLVFCRPGLRREEDIMSRNLYLIASCTLALAFCSPGRGQDSPSLGDIARQSQKDKAKKPQAKVITNDDMPSSSGGLAPSLGGGAGRVVQPATGGNSGAIQSPAEGLQKLQDSVDHLASLDRATLATDVLEGNASDFPGRAKWEEKLFAAKQTFVAQTRGVLQRAQKLTATSEAIKDADDPNDPRVKDLGGKLQQLVEETQQNSAAFQAVVAEGKQLAEHSAAQ